MQATVCAQAVTCGFTKPDEALAADSRSGASTSPRLSFARKRSARTHRTGRDKGIIPNYRGGIIQRLGTKPSGLAASQSTNWRMRASLSNNSRLLYSSARVFSSKV